MCEYTIAIDAMGGDFGPKVTVPAAIRILKKYDNVRMILVGKQEQLLNRIARHGFADESRLTVQNATQEVGMDELPSQALRYKKDSSMRVAINLVKEGRAQACVSAGNTGALMATARFVLKTLPGIDRPALMTAIPTNDPVKEVHVLDLGANVDSCADNLYQFAVMGSVVTSAVCNIEHPRVGLLNIGEEEIKGNDQVKHTAQLLTESEMINYVGYIEGDAVFSGGVDVVVCDGFVGNVALKTAEGVAKAIFYTAKEAFLRNLYGKIIAFLAKPVLKRVKKKFDPSRHNGASLLGLNGIVIKSHGGANSLAFANAIEEAVIEVEKNVPKLIRQKVEIMLEENK